MAVACYVPQYRPFSFKGRRALDVDVSYEGGRRGAEGEFPFGENTAYADLGRRIRRFHVKVAFRENTHLADARAFFRVCESPGPGLLVHPSYGSIMAACKSIKVNDNRETSQGETTADIEFVEGNRWGSSYGLGGLLSGLSVVGIVGAAQTAFRAGYDAVGAPYYATRAITDSVTTTVSGIRDDLVSVVGLTDDPTVARIVHELDDVASDPVLAQSTDAAWLGISGGLAAIDNYGKTAEAKLTAFRRIANRAANPPVRIISRAQKAHDTVAAVTRTLAAAYMARASLGQISGTMQDGFAVYDRTMALIEDEARIAYEACDNALHIGIREFVPQAQSVMLERVYGLPPLISYPFGTGVMAVVAAHEIYGDARRLASIEAHNPAGWAFMVGPDVIAPRPESTSETTLA